jgi:hypothetical protein
MRKVLAGALLLAPLVFAAACYQERERLDVPEITMTTDVDSVSPGDTLRGTLNARDESGLILVRLLVTYRPDSLTPNVDTLRLRYDLPELRDVEVTFAVPIAATSPIGGRVALVAAAFDDQDFQVETTDTLWVVP